MAARNDRVRGDTQERCWIRRRPSTSAAEKNHVSCSAVRVPPSRFEGLLRETPRFAGGLLLEPHPSPGVQSSMDARTANREFGQSACERRVSSEPIRGRFPQNLERLKMGRWPNSLST